MESGIGGGGRDNHDEDMPDEKIVDFTARREERIQSTAETQISSEIEAEQKRIHALINGLDLDQAKYDALQAELIDLGVQHSDKGIPQETLDSLSPYVFSAATAFSDALQHHAGNEPALAQAALADTRKDMKLAFDMYFDAIRRAHQTR